MRYRAIIALLLITQLMCSGSLGGVLNTQEGWSDAQVYQYFDKQSDIFVFNAQLKADGYKYIKIPFVILPTYDYRISPNNTLANGGGNCAADQSQTTTYWSKKMNGSTVKKINGTYVDKVNGL